MVLLLWYCFFPCGLVGMGWGDCVFIGRRWWERIGQIEILWWGEGEEFQLWLGKRRKGKGIIVTKQVFKFFFLFGVIKIKCVTSSSNRNVFGFLLLFYLKSFLYDMLYHWLIWSGLVCWITSAITTRPFSFFSFRFLLCVVNFIILLSLFLDGYGNLVSCQLCIYFRIMCPQFYFLFLSFMNRFMKGMKMKKIN